MYTVPMAYLLWFLSGFGVMGFHRFYLGKIGTGVLYCITGGLFMVGAIVDFFRLPDMVREANLGFRYREVLMDERNRFPAARRPKESIEKTILRAAKKNRGRTTPAEIALASDLSMEQAQKYLEKLASKGYAEMRVKKSGVIVYVFPEFVDDDVDYEDF